MPVIVICLTVSALRGLQDKYAMVKKYYYAVYGAKVAALHIVKWPFFAPGAHFYASKFMLLPLL